jgi:hypothetical protein
MHLHVLPMVHSNNHVHTFLWVVIHAGMRLCWMNEDDHDALKNHIKIPLAIFNGPATPTGILTVPMKFSVFLSYIFCIKRVHGSINAKKVNIPTKMITFECWS